MNKALKYSLIAAGALLAIGAMLPKQPAANPAKAPQAAAVPAPAAEVVEVAAATLARTYRDNEAGADLLFKGKALDISGRVETVRKDVFDRTIVALKGSDQFHEVSAYMADQFAFQAASLKPGLRIVARCIGSGAVLQMAQAKECRIEQVSGDL